MALETLGRYRILRPHGAGGMGVVYLARDTHLNRDVAIKVLRAGALSDAEARHRFRNEATALSQLNHPCIATIFDFATDDDVDYIVMEYVPGVSLDEQLKSGPLSAEQLESVGAQIADGLAVAHAQGIVHRDLKPANIRLLPDGRAKILDFGLAKLLRDIGEHSVTQVMSAPNTVMGTPAYMSPEQLRGESVGAPSDLFSLGVTLYEAWSGKHPFDAPSLELRTQKILQERPTPPSKIRKGLPRDLELLIQELMNKDASARPRSAEGVAGRLRSIGGQSSATASRRTRPRQPVALAGLVTSLLLVGYLSPPRETLATAKDVGVVHRLTSTGRAAVPVWSPDGRYIAYKDGINGQVIIETPDGTSSRPLANSKFSQVVPWGWTPDSRAVLAHGLPSDTSQTAVILLPLVGPAKILVRNAYFPDMSRDGRYLAFATDSPEHGVSICILDVGTGTRRMLVEARGEGTASYKPKWSPDGRRVSYMRWNGTGHELWLVDSDGRNDHRVDTGPVETAGLYSWLPDGRSVIIGGELNGMWGIWKIPLNGRGIKSFHLSSEEDLHVTASPDGRRFVFQRAQDASRVAIIDLARNSVSMTVSTSVGAQHPAFTPDGTALLYQSMVNGRWQVFRAPLDGQGDPQPMLALGLTSAFSPTMTHDGRLLHIRAKVGRQWRFGRIEWSQTVWAHSLDSGKDEPLMPEVDRVERMAPGSFLTSAILFTTNTKQDREALYVSRPGEPPLQVYEDNARRGIGGFDWGRSDNEVLLALNFDPSAGFTNSISTLDLKSSELKNLLTWTRPGTGEDLNFGDVTAIAMSPSRHILAILGGTGRGRPRGLYLFDMTSGKARLAHRFENGEIPLNPTWSPGGDRLAVELQGSNSDLFICDLDGDRAIASR